LLGELESTTTYHALSTHDHVTVNVLFFLPVTQKGAEYNEEAGQFLEPASPPSAETGRKPPNMNSKSGKAGLVVADDDGNGIDKLVGTSRSRIVMEAVRANRALPSTWSGLRWRDMTIAHLAPIPLSHSTFFWTDLTNMRLSLSLAKK
jgi:hypothetical protein